MRKFVHVISFINTCKGLWDRSVLKRQKKFLFQKMLKNYLPCGEYNGRKVSTISLYICPEFAKVGESLQDSRSGDLPEFTRPTSTLPDRIYCDTCLFIKNMVAAWKKDKKWVIKTVLTNDLRFYMFLHKVWMSFYQTTTFSNSICILDPKCCQTFGLVTFNFLRTGTDFTSQVQRSYMVWERLFVNHHIRKFVHVIPFINTCKGLWDRSVLKR